MSPRTLRGNQPLREAHLIDWSFFAGRFHGGRIDQGDQRGFRLPQSTIPGTIKCVYNLIQRDLVRSHQVSLCTGEDLAELYGIPELKPAQVEPDLTYGHSSGSKAASSRRHDSPNLHGIIQ